MLVLLFSIADGLLACGGGGSGAGGGGGGVVGMPEQPREPTVSL
jgi:hypothetical protein